jgi:hypothetical protein
MRYLDQKCANPGCGCLANEEIKYCSSNCATKVDGVGVSCGCSHPPCAESATNDPSPTGQQIAA